MENFKTIINREVTDFAKEHPQEYKLIIDKIRTYFSRNFPDVEYWGHLSSFINELIDTYFNQALEAYNISRSRSLCTEIIEIADYYLDRRYDVMIALDDEEAFQKVLGYATDFLKGGDFLFDQQLYVNSQSFYALVEAYYNPKFKKEVDVFFKTAFEYAKVYAKEKIEYGKQANADPDAETLLELAQAISSFKEEDREQFADIVFEIYTFSSDEKRSYSMNQASGFIAIQLTYFQTVFYTAVLHKAITETGKHYEDSVFVHQTLYTKWFLEKNTKEPLLYLQNNENENLIFAVFALTDLGCKEALPLLVEKQKEEKDPVIWEIYNEAIQRLESDFIPVDQTERMIWLNGNLTPTQRALGAENDNVFVQRAKQKFAIDDNVYETDNN
ncbi:hypothetical protein [Flavobacterium piscis]|uniref:Uncharacterized protein n=1 Tax=Flavobacterium piscis TaxID=1114874 RepID=A0ABU1YCW8_9FLAO|nr:hypothetical protein [Flavobacterium piscis]MDR7212090.1 hypothetical protein [Flavobacterium piscis]